MKKLFVLLVIFILTNLVQSCKKNHYLIVDIDFYAAFISKNNKDKEHIEFSRTSSIKDKLIFIVSYETEFIYFGYISNFGNVCYATKQGVASDNELLRNTFSLTFDKEFTYNGNTISAMTDIFKIETITKEMDVYKCYYTYPFGFLVINFSDNFFKNSVFDKTEEYVVTFSCETSDEKFFEKTITITFE
jgi:hypothetical protein